MRRRAESVSGEESCEKQTERLDLSKMPLANPSMSPNDYYRMSDLETVTVEVGKQSLQPIQFHSLEVGAVSMTTLVRPGETVQQAMDRANEECRKQQAKQFEQQLSDFKIRLNRIKGARGE